MRTVAHSAAQDYSPTSQEARQAAAEFIEAANGWGARMRDAQTQLRQFVETNSGGARGFVARDQLNMSVFGLVFDKAPAAGFLAVPGPVADDLRAQGLRGEAFFPDTSHPLGKQVMSLMSKLSRVAEQRPLLNGVPGVAAVALEGERVVLSRAVVNTAGEVVVKAAPGALQPNASVELTRVRTLNAGPSDMLSAGESRTTSRSPRM